MPAYKIVITKDGAPDDVFETYKILADHEYRAFAKAVIKFELEYPDEDSELFDFDSAIVR